MRKYRDRLSLIAAILDVASRGASKTKIMFLANLSYQLLEKYLQAAINLDFIHNDGQNYELTEKGQRFLKKYDHLNGRYHKAQKKLDDLTSEREKLCQLCRQGQTSVPSNTTGLSKSRNLYKKNS